PGTYLNARHGGERAGHTAHPLAPLTRPRPGSAGMEDLFGFLHFRRSLVSGIRLKPPKATNR
ncbi:MAG: hypothetical protein SWC40_00585, partial [Thermodesulfobacteriota bacterium]|nr:hypothetical protein [Thermodesulfobacteriota bacterium]